MGIFSCAPPFDRVHGKIVGESGENGVVAYSSARGGNIFRAFVIPENPESTLQVAMRSYLTLAAAAYKDISAAQALIWETTANQINRDNILGISYTLTGIGLFCMVNVYRQMNGQAIVDDMPTIEQPIKPVGITSVVLTNATTLTIVADFTGNDVGFFGVCRISLPLPGEARQARSGDCRLRSPTISDNIIAVAGTTVTFVITIVALDYVATDRIGIELTPLSDAYVPGLKTLVGNFAVAAP